MFFNKKRLIRISSLDSLKEDLMNEQNVYKKYLQYTKENPKSNGQWWNFTNLYKEFYVYSFPAIMDKNPEKIKYAKVHYTTIMEKGHNYPITLSLLYNCGENTGVENGEIIGHFEIEGNRNDFLDEIFDNGYQSNDGRYFSGQTEYVNFHDIKQFAQDELKKYQKQKTV